MGIGRSTFYDAPDTHTLDLIIVAEMKMICDEFEAYGYRRLDAELRHRGIVVNTKKIRPLMREHALIQSNGSGLSRRRIAITTIRSSPISRRTCCGRPQPTLVADITYVAIATGFVYLAAILDAWSRRS